MGSDEPVVGNSEVEERVRELERMRGPRDAGGRNSREAHSKADSKKRISQPPSSARWSTASISSPMVRKLVIVLRDGLTAILTVASGKSKPKFLERAIPEDLMGRADQSCRQKGKKPHERDLLGSQVG